MLFRRNLQVSTAEVIKTLETAFRRDEKVIRFQTVKLDKYAVEYAEKRRNKLGAKTEEA